MDERLKLQWIDGQRPGAAGTASADTGEPGPLTPADAPLVERAARADRAIQAALDDVPVPAGLADRLHARLAEDRGKAQPGVQAAQPVPPTCELWDDARAPAAAAPARFTRRRFAVAAAGLGLVAGSGWLLSRLWQPGAPWGMEELLASALDQLPSDLAGVRMPLATANRSAYPLPRGLLAREATCVGWSNAIFLGRTAVCYHLTAGGKQAALWVAPLTGGRPLPPELGYQRFAHSHSTGGKVGMAWQTPDVLYVAATKAEGGAEQLKLFIAADEVRVAQRSV